MTWTGVLLPTAGSRLLPATLPAKLNAALLSKTTPNAALEAAFGVLTAYPDLIAEIELYNNGVSYARLTPPRTAVRTNLPDLSAAPSDGAPDSSTDAPVLVAGISA